jgi:hypothetical protein
MLLELIGLPREQWRHAATALIEEYREASVLDELRRQLFVPRGFAKILWHTRTNLASTRQVEQRLESVRAIIQRVARSSSTQAGTPLYRDAG